MTNLYDNYSETETILKPAWDGGWKIPNPRERESEPKIAKLTAPELANLASERTRTLAPARAAETVEKNSKKNYRLTEEPSHLIT